MINKLIICLLVLMMPLQVFGAISTVDGGSGNINYGSDGSIDGFSENTLIMWTYPQSINATLNRMIASKEALPSTFEKEWTVRNSTGQLDFIVNTSGTSATARSSSTPGNVLVAGTWAFVAFTVSSSLVPRIYLGTATTTVKEVAYTTQTTGTGTADDDSAANLLIGNTQALTRGANHRYAYVAYYNRELSLAELRAIQFTLMPLSGLRLSSNIYGTGTQADGSGWLNNGTVTGGTVAPHVPLRPPSAMASQDNSFAMKVKDTFFVFVDKIKHFFL